jgi:hypothetical protein
MWNLVLVILEIVLVLVQDRGTLCANHTIGIEIVLDAPNMVLLGGLRQVKARFGQFRYNANLDAR